MKIIKRISIAVLCVVIVPVLLFSAYCIYLSDGGINGFVGMAGIIRLNMREDSYTKLTDEPIQVLIRRGENDNQLEVFLTQYFDSVDNFYYHGSGELDGIKYKYETRAFTGNYDIITITELVE